MARTTVKDFFTKEEGSVNNAITFIHNGDIKKSFLSIEELKSFNDIDNLHCVFGAPTSINFQYSFILECTDYHGTYIKECNKKTTKKNVIIADVDATSKLYSLASYGFKIVKRGNNRFLVISPRYQKLVSIRRILDGCEGYFNYLFIGCDRFDGLTNLGHVEVDHGDIIKLSQSENRHFDYRWISKRVDKSWN